MKPRSLSVRRKSDLKPDIGLSLLREVCERMARAFSTVCAHKSLQEVILECCAHGDGSRTAIGLMSGTSMDGIDVALLRTDGEASSSGGRPWASPTIRAFRERLQAALETAKAIARRDERPGDLAELERELTLRHAAAVTVVPFDADNDLTTADVDVIGFHGQTVLHRPDDGPDGADSATGSCLPAKRGIDVVYDMRAQRHGPWRAGRAADSRLSCSSGPQRCRPTAPFRSSSSISAAFPT